MKFVSRQVKKIKILSGMDQSLVENPILLFCSAEPNNDYIIILRSFYKKKLRISRMTINYYYGTRQDKVLDQNTQLAKKKCLFGGTKEVRSRKDIYFLLLLLLFFVLQ